MSWNYKYSMSEFHKLKSDVLWQRVGCLRVPLTRAKDVNKQCRLEHHRLIFGLLSVKFNPECVYNNDVSNSKTDRKIPITNISMWLVENIIKTMEETVSKNKIYILVFKVMTPCNNVVGNRGFGRPYCLHLQGEGWCRKTKRFSRKTRVER
jgi:hypothetical protein